MNILFTVVAHLLRNIAILLRPGGTKSIIAENLLLKQQLMVLNRSRRRAPNTTTVQRLLFARLCSFTVQPIAIDGPALCRMFNEAMAGSCTPGRFSLDNDPLFEFFINGKQIYEFSTLMP